MKVERQPPWFRAELLDLGGDHRDFRWGPPRFWVGTTAILGGNRRDLGAGTAVALGGKRNGFGAGTTVALGGNHRDEHGI